MVTLWLLGVTTTEFTPVRVTETVVVPVQAEQLPALPVMVDEPMTSPVASPDGDIETEFGSLEDQATPELICLC